MSLNDLLPNWTLIPQMLVFWTVLWVLSKFIFKQYGALIELRIEETTGLQKEAESMQQKAAELKNEYEGRMNGIRTELHKMLEEEKRRYQSEVNTIVAKAKMEAVSEIQRMEELIHRESHRVTKELSSQVEQFSEEITNKIIGRGIAS